MAKSPKPIAMMSKNLTKEEKENREEQEKKLKGNNDKVYKVPKGTNRKVAKIYKDLVKELAAADILNNLDIELIMTTSYAIFRMREAREVIDELGTTVIVYEDVKDSEGNVKKIVSQIYKNPAVQVEKDYQAIFHQGCLQLGLSPSSRAKLAIMNIDATSKEESDEDKLFG